MNKPITKIVYSFQDESVPPQYHRSYTITVTKDFAHIVLKSYDNILADKTIDISEDVLNELQNDIETLNIKEKEPPNEIIDTGGSSKSLTVFSNGDVLLEGTIYQSRDHQEGSITGDITHFIKKIEELFPNFEKLISPN